MPLALHRLFFASARAETSYVLGSFTSPTVRPSYAECFAILGVRRTPHVGCNPERPGSCLLHNEKGGRPPAAKISDNMHDTTVWRCDMCLVCEVQKMMVSIHVVDAQTFVTFAVSPTGHQTPPNQGLRYPEVDACGLCDLFAGEGWCIFVQ